MLYTCRGWPKLCFDFSLVEDLESRKVAGAHAFLSSPTLGLSGNLIHSAPLQLRPGDSPPSRVAVGAPLMEELEQQRWNFLFSFSKSLKSVLLNSSIMGPGILIIWFKNKQKKDSGFFSPVHVNSLPYFVFYRLFKGRQEPFPSLPLLSRLVSDFLAVPPTVTHSFVCLFFHLQLLPPPKSWLAQGNYSNLFHFKCIQKGIWIVPFHLEQHPNLELMKNWGGGFGIYLPK